ncbi:RTA1-domain-containing protein [Aulographum hederae CBS 113979]|uniref:RTA1-domain-containing protein n=1 Tax=Aulographum hederae CBS 113979 TaxID=1176131 RepID=A0A6G1GKZ9_9PEZI|nr:RTA1-domain-containing protein [Aulographum hederae CBS 113979]
MPQSVDGLSHYYPYAPSTDAAIVASILFGIITIFHTYQLVATRTWFFMPTIVGGIFETFGFIARIVNAQEEPLHWSFPPFVLQTLGILLAPTFFAAAIYMEFGRIILLADGESRSFIRRTWLTKIFVTMDILSFAIQALGGIMSIQDNKDTAKSGQNIVIAGLWAQIVSFGIFLINLTVWWVRVAKHPTPMSLTMPWKKHLIVSLLASALIFVRCIYRVIEYTQGEDGEFMRHEVYQYALDAIPMFGILVVWLGVHPSEVMGLLRGGKVAFLWKLYPVRAAKGDQVELGRGGNQSQESWIRGEEYPSGASYQQNGYAPSGFPPNGFRQENPAWR